MAEREVSDDLFDVITVITKSEDTLKHARTKSYDAGSAADLLRAQLHGIRTALEQVLAFLRTTSLRNGTEDQLATDMNTIVRHCKVLVQSIDDSVSLLTWIDPEGSDRSPLEEDTLRNNMVSLSNQILALNLSLTASSW